MWTVGLRCIVIFGFFVWRLRVGFEDGFYDYLFKNAFFLKGFIDEFLYVC